MTRQEANFKILEVLWEYAITFPDSRFTQMLFNLGIDSKSPSNSLVLQDKYAEESQVTLEKLDPETLKRLKSTASSNSPIPEIKG